MRRKTNLMAAALLLLIGSGCGSSMNAQKLPTPNPGSPVQGGTRVPGSEPTPVLDFRLGSTTDGRITGVLVDTGTRKGLAEVELCLIPYNPATKNWGVPRMPSEKTDSMGTFLFEAIPPGQYSLFSITWSSSWSDPFGSMHTFEVEPGGTTDLGQISVDH